MSPGNGINQEKLFGKHHSTAIKELLQSIQFKVRGGDEALNRNFNKPEKESIIYNSLGCHTHL